jgi:hypothetical protein
MGMRGFHRLPFRDRRVAGGRFRRGWRWRRISPFFAIDLLFYVEANYHVRYFDHPLLRFSAPGRRESQVADRLAPVSGARVAALA